MNWRQKLGFLPHWLLLWLAVVYAIAWWSTALSFGDNKAMGAALVMAVVILSPVWIWKVAKVLASIRTVRSRCTSGVAGTKRARNDTTNVHREAKKNQTCQQHYGWMSSALCRGCGSAHEGAILRRSLALFQSRDLLAQFDQHEFQFLDALDAVLRLREQVLQVALVLLELSKALLDRDIQAGEHTQ